MTITFHFPKTDVSEYMGINSILCLSKALKIRENYSK